MEIIDDHMCCIPSVAAKTFGHCKINWLISDFCLQTSKMGWKIRSPEFTINGYEETKWVLILQPKSNTKNYKVQLILERSVNDSGPESVSVNFRAHYKFRCPHAQDKLFSLEKGSAYIMSFGGILCLYEQLKPFKTDTVAILCKMIVYSDCEDGRFSVCSDPGIKLLSDNLYNLYTSGENYDTMLMLTDDVILAHRAVLTARSTVLSDLIYHEQYQSDLNEEFEDDNCMIVELPSILDSVGMRQTLAYLYSGDVRHVLGKPSYSIYQIAVFLKLSDIIECYLPDRITLRSSLDTQNFAYELLFPDFRGDYEHTFSLECETNDCSTLYHLRLDPKTQNETDCYHFFTTIFEKPMNACLDVAVSDSHDNLYLETRSLIHADDICKKVIYDKLLKRRFVETDDAENLKLIINICFTTGECSSFIEDQIINFTDCFRDTHWENLSLDMEDALMGDYTDLLIYNNGVYLPVHKCIVACRSQFMTCKLKTSEEGEVVVISDIDPETLRILIFYLYTGAVTDVDDDDFIELYKVAIAMELPSLKNICSDRLKSCLKFNESIICRVMKIAEENDDKTLKDSVLNYWFNCCPCMQYIHGNLSHTFEDASACRNC